MMPGMQVLIAPSGTHSERNKGGCQGLLAQSTRTDHGLHDYDLEAVEFFKKFNKRLVNNPYEIAFAQGDRTCTVADWTVLLKKAMEGNDGKMVQPGKVAHLEFCTVATW
jgi:hypothetical protein